MCNADWTYQHFAAFLHDTFHVEQLYQTRISLQLIEATPYPASANYESFGLVFRGPNDAPLPQATHRFQHAAFGDLDLFIVPIRQDAGGLYYEVIFNRAVGGAA